MWCLTRLLRQRMGLSTSPAAGSWRKAAWSAPSRLLWRSNLWLFYHTMSSSSFFLLFPLWWKCPWLLPTGRMSVSRTKRLTPCIWLVLPTLVLGCQANLWTVSQRWSRMGWNQWIDVEHFCKRTAHMGWLYSIRSGFVHIFLKSCREGGIIPFNHPVCLGMVSGHTDATYSQHLVEFLHQICCEIGASIC